MDDIVVIERFRSIGCQMLSEPTRSDDFGCVEVLKLTKEADRAGFLNIAELPCRSGAV